MKTKITPGSIHVGKNGDRWVVECSDATARYHYWSFDGIDLTPDAGDTLFKNPLATGLTRYDAGYFKTRYLKIEKNLELVEIMRRVGVTKIEIAKQEEIEREAKREEKAAAEYRARVMATVKQYANHLKMPLDQIDDAELASALSHMIGDLSIGRKLSA